MARGFWILPTNANDIAYVKLYKDNFETKEVKMSEDINSNNYYTKLNLENKNGTIVFVHSRLNIAIQVAYGKKGILLHFIRKDLLDNLNGYIKLLVSKDTIDLSEDASINNIDDISSYINNKLYNIHWRKFIEGYPGSYFYCKINSRSITKEKFLEYLTSSISLPEQPMEAKLTFADFEEDDNLESEQTKEVPEQTKEVQEQTKEVQEQTKEVQEQTEEVPEQVEEVPEQTEDQIESSGISIDNTVENVESSGIEVTNSSDDIKSNGIEITNSIDSERKTLSELKEAISGAINAVNETTESMDNSDIANKIIEETKSETINAVGENIEIYNKSISEQHSVEVEQAKAEEAKQVSKINDNEKSNPISSDDIKNIFSELMKDYTSDIKSMIQSSKSSSENDIRQDIKNSDAYYAGFDDEEAKAEITKKLKELSAKENELNTKLKDAENLKNALYDALEIAKSNTVESIGTQVVGVESIVTLDGSKDRVQRPTESFVYEMMLKIMHPEDTISIPNEVYNALPVKLLKNLYMNVEYTKYKAIVELKIEQNSDNFVLAVIDYDEEEQFTRVTVMKPYNNEPVSSRELTDYELRYIQWHRKNSFINT